MKRIKRILTVLLAVVLMCGLMPFEGVTARAASTGEKYYKRQEANLPYLANSIASFKQLTSNVRQEDYTEDSWQLFQDAMDSLDQLTVPEKITNADEQTLYNRCDAAYDDAYYAYYFGLTPKEEIQVTFRTMDPSGSRATDMKLYPGDLMYKSVPIEAGYSGKVTLKDTFTLEKLIQTAGIQMPESEGYWGWTTVGVFINGIYVSGDYAAPESYHPQERNGIGMYEKVDFEYMQNDQSYKSIKLHPNDDVTVIYTPILYSKQTPTIAYRECLFGQYIDDIRYETFDDSVVEVAAGKDAILKVNKKPASMLSSGDQVPADGMKLYISQKQESNTVNAPAKTPMTADGEYIFTDENGQAKIRLYEEGWYLIAAYDSKEDVMGDQNQDTLEITKGDYYSANSGALVWVHVTPSEDPSEVKTELKKDLTDLAEQYPEEIFRGEDWIKIRDYLTAALSAIDGAKTVNDAYLIQQEAFKKIKNIQEKTVKENKDKPESFRSTLLKLPEDVSLITKGQQSLVDSLINCYTGMSEYQKSLLNRGEINRYNQIAALNQAGLPEAKKYKLNFVVKADTEDAARALQSMTDYLYAHTPKMDQVGAPEPDKINSYGAFTIVRGLNEFTESLPLNQIQVITNINYAAYLLTRDAGEAAGYTISGDGWSISDVDSKDLTIEEKTNKYMSYDVNGNVTVKVGDVKYHVKSIKFTGVDAKDVTTNQLSYYDHTDYKGKDPENVNMYFADAYHTFVMPYNDVTVTVEWEAENDLAAYFDGFNKSDYTSAKWNRLVELYNDGQAAYKAANTVEEKEKVLKNTKSAMDAIPKRGPEASAIDGWGEGDEFDAGEPVGTVDISICNTTYADAPFVEDIVSQSDYPIGANDNMMTVVLRALADDGFDWNGTGGDYGITYLASIGKDGQSLGEYDGGPESGWMGTLNDFFVNESFSAFSVANNKLADGDSICIMYTSSGLGEDLGGSFYNSDTSLKDLQVSGGVLTPDFSSRKNSYVLKIDGNKANVFVTPTAANKNYLTKTFLNEKVTSNKEGNSYYKRTRSIPVKPGDVIYVGCGEYAWPSMNKQGDEARDCHGTWYELHVMSADEDPVYVQELIDALPTAAKINLNNYKDVDDKIAYIESILQLFSEEEAADIDLTRLNETKEKISYYGQIDLVKELIVNLDSSDSNAVRDVIGAYDALSEQQREYLTVAQTNKINRLMSPYAKAVEDKIAEIGEVSLESKDVIEAARNAYDSLLDSEKALVSEDVLKVLLDAEKSYAELNPGNHDFSEQPYQVDEDGKHYQKCKDCGAESTHEAHTGGTATCTKKAVCEVCEKEYGELAAHTLKTTTVTKATTTNNGKQETKCTVCNKVTKTATIYAAKTIKLSATTYTYDGKAKKPTVTVKDSAGTTLKKDTDYTVTYATGRKAVGKYEVTIKGKGNYNFTKELSFKINPVKTSITSLTKGTKSFTVKWAKKTTQTTGYEIQYSTSSTFKAGTATKKVTVKSNKTTSKTIKNLKAKKKYYVRVRTYKTVSGTKYYSGWSAKKYVTTK